MCVDAVETFVYLACENLNVYQYPLGYVAASGQKSQTPSTENSVKKRATMSHKKKVTAMVLTKDGRFLVTGDAQGLMYIW
jgi:hypothetical protein